MKPTLSRQRIGLLRSTFARVTVASCLLLGLAGSAQADTIEFKFTKMDGTAVVGELPVGGQIVGGACWRVIHMADFDGDGQVDLLWECTMPQASGPALRVWAIWLLNPGGQTMKASAMVSPPNTAIPITMDWRSAVVEDWRVQGVADLDGDGKADILWRRAY